MTRKFCLCLFIVGLFVSSALAGDPTNVVFVISDDQGYGDLACTGNPIIKTPNIDHLASESSGLSDYHVAPTARTRKRVNIATRPPCWSTGMNAG